MYFTNIISPPKFPSHSVSIHFSSELTDNSVKNPLVNNTVHHVNSFVHQCLHLCIPQSYRNFTRKLFSTKTIFLSPNHKNQGSAKDNGNQLLLPQQQNKSAQCSFSQVTSLCTRRHPFSVDSPLLSSTTPTLFHSIHRLLKPVHSQTLLLPLSAFTHYDSNWIFCAPSVPSTHHSHHPSLPHCFIPGLKPSFSANPSHCNLPFLLQD